MKLFAFMAAAGIAFAQLAAPVKVTTDAPASGLLQVRRIYVAELKGGPDADALRELIIAGINSTGLFTLTDDETRADAVLKGAADEHTFEDTLDTNEGLSSRQNGGKSSGSTLRNGLYGGFGISESESHHMKERKHEAYAAVRLCSRDGDVLWSTTQESLGAKFKGAGADVAARVARQLALDYDRARRLKDQAAAGNAR
ncbi:MAG: hypothetical protein JOZ62_13160 [Acidobacteriaceae bacterium]|nr:hypothetical protein [Acidobacteriaceae bacterium]